MDLPKRKTIRLPNYDYSSPGAYFVTVCTRDRRCLLSEINVGADALGGPCLSLTATGKVVEKYILSTDRICGVSIDKYVIMPNHIHLILRISDEPQSGPPRASAPTVSDAIGAMKRLINKEVGANIWQRSFHEHVIRGAEDYAMIWDYIEQNPAKWAEDRYYSE